MKSLYIPYCETDTDGTGNAASWKMSRTRQFSLRQILSFLPIICESCNQVTCSDMITDNWIFLFNAGALALPFTLQLPLFKRTSRNMHHINNKQQSTTYPDFRLNFRISACFRLIFIASAKVQHYELSDPQTMRPFYNFRSRFNFPSSIISEHYLSIQQHHQPIQQPDQSIQHP